MRHNASVHHRESIRLQGYDYSAEGAYFVTICTRGRQCLFGQIVDGSIIALNEFGEIVRDEWSRTSEIRTGIVLDEFVVMPNHVHGIIVIDDGVSGRRSTRPLAPTGEQFGKPVSYSIPTIIRGFKAAATTKINTLRRTAKLPVWQRNYYERIIRNDRELNAVRQYILSNAANWEKDEEYVV